MIDYPSVTKRGQGNETLEAIRGGKQRVREEAYDAENDAIRRGKSEAEETAALNQEVDLNLEIKKDKMPFAATSLRQKKKTFSSNLPKVSLLKKFK